MFRKAPERMGVSAVFGDNRYLVPFNRGIATPVCALARNDSFFGCARVNNNLQPRWFVPVGGGAVQNSLTGLPERQSGQVSYQISG